MGSTVFDLSDKVNYFHTSNNGFGLPDVTLYSEQGPMQHGATYLDYRLEPRDITLGIALSTRTFEEYMDHRKKLFNIFKPKRPGTTLSLRLVLDENVIGTDRQIDVVYVDGLQADAGQKSGLFHRFAIVLRAFDPTWYEPTPITFTSQTPAGQGFSVPMSVPFSVGASTINQTYTIPYMGTADSYPLITLIGPMRDVVITNELTGDFIALDAEIEAGDVWYVDTRYGYKTVTTIGGENKMSVYRGNIETFRLLAAEDDSDYLANTITVTSTNASVASKILLTYHQRYIGV